MAPSVVEHDQGADVSLFHHAQRLGGQDARLRRRRIAGHALADGVA
jgi:hypothetical protein